MVGKRKIPMPGSPVRGSKSGAPIMALLDLLGRRWALGIVWILAERGGASFAELEAACETISPGVLSARLQDLRAAQLVHKDERTYRLTVEGDALFQHIRPLGAWAKDSWAALLHAETAA